MTLVQFALILLLINSTKGQYGHKSHKELIQKQTISFLEELNKLFWFADETDFFPGSLTWLKSYLVVLLS